jgi:hypothetical protein
MDVKKGNGKVGEDLVSKCGKYWKKWEKKQKVQRVSKGRGLDTYFNSS